jgi:hypothetical protein
MARNRMSGCIIGQASLHLSQRERPVGQPKDTTLKRFPSGFLVAGLLVLSGLMWAVMFFGPLAHLARLADGLTPFDVRPRGYSYAEARALLEAIGEQGRRYYASPELVIDTFYPPLYALSRGLALWWLTMPERVREGPVPLKVRYALIAVPILMASLDLFENGCIGRDALDVA